MYSSADLVEGGLKDFNCHGVIEYVDTGSNRDGGCEDGVERL